MKLDYPALIFLALITTGCSSQLHRPQTHAEGWHHEKWKLHCETAESHSPVSDEGPGVHNREWIWATTAEGDAIYLHGRLEDGFLLVDGIRGDSADTLQHVTPDVSGLRSLCMQTLLRDHANKTLELAQVRAARHGESIDIPIIFTTGEAAAEDATRLVVFGDSLSDTGNLKNRLGVFPAAPYWIGRFSNGPVWVDYLEANENVAIRNHSYGGASVTWHGHKPGEGVIEMVKQGGQYFVTGSLEQQVEDYINGDLGGELLHRPDNTIFLIWVGANDYIWKEPFTGSISTFLNSPKGEAGFEQVVDEVISSLAVEINKLYRAGGRRFVVLNLPDIGKSPMVLQNSTYFAPTATSSEEERRLELSRRLTNLTDYHNEQLAALAEDIVGQLLGAQVHVVDTNRTLRRLMNEDAEASSEQPFDYGFALDQHLEIVAAKDRVVALQKRCYSGGYLGSSDKDEVCSRQEAAMFWDSIHPSTLTHCWQAFFIGQTLVQLGVDMPSHSLEDQRDWCVRVAEREPGHVDTEWSLR